MKNPLRLKPLSEASLKRLDKDRDRSLRLAEVLRHKASLKGKDEAVQSVNWDSGELIN